MRRLAYASLFVLALACASSSTQTDSDTPDDDDEAAEPDEPETERERLIREAKDKREQCETLGDAIQRGEVGEDELVNLNDSAKLQRLADTRAAAAERVSRLEVSNGALAAVQKDYVQLARDMAHALGEAAQGKKDAQRKAALRRYQSLDQGTGDIIERFNAACDGSGG